MLRCVPTEPGVEGDSLARAFAAPSVAIKDFAISQTTRCTLDNNGMSGNKYIEPATAAKYYATCVRVKRASFGFMGYSLRTADYRYTGWFVRHPRRRPSRAPTPLDRLVFCCSLAVSHPGRRRRPGSMQPARPNLLART